MDESIKPVAVNPGDKKWDEMDRREKAIFAMKVTVMVCSFGWIFGNVLAP